MPRRVPPHPHWNSNDTRYELITRTSQAELSSGGARVRAAAVPLFRHSEGGGLAQAIRLHVETDDALTGIELAVQAGANTLDRTTVEAPAGGASFHLFVPEVDHPTRFTIAAAAPGAPRATAEIEVTPQRKWSVYAVHHSHFDYGYTDTQATVMAQQFGYLDAALDLIADTDDWPDDARFRWNVEVHYPLQKWLAARPRAVHDEFVRRVKDGRIEVNALPFSMHTEVYSIDELAWGLNFADELRVRHGIEIVSAIQSDVPGAAIGLLNLLTSAGIRYLSVAHNYAGRSVPFRLDGQELTRPFWWQGADGKRLLVWHTDTPHGIAYMDGVLVGLPNDEATARGLLPDYLLALATLPYPYGKHAFGWHDLPLDLPVTKQPYPHDILHLRVQNGFADNAPPSLAIAQTIRDWNERWAYPRLRMATNRDFFADAEARLGEKVDTFAGDWTDWWADGVGSGALPLGLNRRAQGTLRTARTLHALADALTNEPSPAAVAETDGIYEEMALFDEHTWGAANPWEDRLERMDSGALQWGAKSAFAYRAFDRANVLLDAGLHRLAGAVRAASEAIASLVVFNPSGWRRTDLVCVFLPDERVPSGRTFALIEAETGRQVAYSLEAQPHPSFRTKGQWLMFAADVPAVGYTRYDVVAGEGSSRTDVSSDDAMRLETQFYRVTCDPRDGFIASIIDRETGRELVDTDAPYGFNEYVYDRYTSAPHFNHLSGRVQDVDLQLFGSRSTARHASVIARSSDAVAERLTLRLVAEGSDWLETTIALPHDVKRVAITNRLKKIATPEKESVYFAFPFAVDDPDPEYEITGGVTSLDAPHVPGSVRHMLAIRHWLSLRDEHGAAAWATLEAPLIELGTIALPYAPFPSTIPSDRTRRSTVYSWALNNIWDTNFPPAQGGEMTFRYVVSSDADPQGARTLGVETGTSLAAPLVGLCLGREGSGNLPARGSFVESSEPLVEVVGLAPSRSGLGVTVFLHSLAPDAVVARLTFPALPARRLLVGNFLERQMSEIVLEGAAAMVELAPGAFVAMSIDR